MVVNLEAIFVKHTSTTQILSVSGTQIPGNSVTPSEVLPGAELKYNPGRIDPTNITAWQASRKPLAAAWETLDGKNKFFTINVHFQSKGGSSPIQGDARPPVNQGVDDRSEQMEITAISLQSSHYLSMLTSFDRNLLPIYSPRTKRPA